MKKAMLHLLLLTNAMLLALPPSWCCTLRIPTASKSVAHKALPPCCAATKESKQSRDENEPSEPRPSVDCCCHVDTSLPPQPEIIAKDISCVSIAAAVEMDAGPGGALVASQTDVVPNESPPLQILHCVWLC